MTDRDQLREALLVLTEAEAAYRQAHDLHGDGSRESGRAWDLMRRAGDNARAILATTPGKKLWCETCGKDVPEVLCPTCAKWWNDNPPPSEATTPDQAVMDERATPAALREQSCLISKTGRTVTIECDDADDAIELLDWLADYEPTIRAQGEPK